jgi:hypothetical protein
VTFPVVTTRRKDIPMSVSNHLGVNDPNQGLLATARQRWPHWGRENQQLRVVDDLLDLPSWLAAGDKARADAVLQTLSRLASPTGDDDLAAATALAWLLLPGARLLAHRMRTLTERIDEVVAAQLWVEVRSFRWRHGHKVAANILMNTRRGVLHDLGVGEQLLRSDPTWARAVPLSPTADLWRVLEVQQPPEQNPRAPEQELDEVLGRAVRDQVLQESDRDLLLTLAAEADRAGVTRGRCGQGGLCSHRASRAAAVQRGVSESTIRRQANRSLRAVAAAYAPIPA